MKKVFNLLFVVALIFVLSSCGFKKEIEEPEIDGEKMSKSKIENFYKEYEDYYKALEDGDEARVISKGWYSVSGNLTYVSSYKDGENQKSATIKAKISGDIYDSNYVYDKMMHLTIRLEIETDGNEKDDTQNIKGKYEMFVKEGMSWVKGSFNCDNEDEKIDKKVYAKGTFDELMDQVPSGIKDIINLGKQNTADMHAFGCSFMKQLKNFDEETTSVYEDGDKYTIQINENNTSNSDTNDNSVKMKSIVEVDFKDKENYVAKEYSTYCGMESSFSNTNINVSYEMSIKKKVMGIIIPPIFEGKYQSYGDSEIFPDIA